MVELLTAAAPELSGAVRPERSTALRMPLPDCCSVSTFRVKMPISTS